MTGSELLTKYISKGDDYSRLLGTIMYNIGKDIQPLLEQAEKEGKRLAIKQESTHKDEITVNDIVIE